MADIKEFIDGISPEDIAIFTQLLQMAEDGVKTSENKVDDNLLPFIRGARFALFLLSFRAKF